MTEALWSIEMPGMYLTNNIPEDLNLQYGVCFWIVLILCHFVLINEKTGYYLVIIVCKQD